MVNANNDRDPVGIFTCIIPWNFPLAIFTGSTEGRPFDLEFTNPFGVFLALASTVIWSLYWIYNTRDKSDPIVDLFLNFVFSIPFIISYYLLTEEARIVPMNGVLGAAYVGAFLKWAFVLSSG